MEELPAAVFEAIVRRTGAPFIVIDLEGTIVFASDTVSWVIGWSVDHVVGRNIADFVRPEDAELAVAAVAEIDTIDRTGAGVPITLPVIVPDGQRYVEVAALPLYDLGIEGLISLRVRIADADHHMAEFVRSLVAGQPLEATMVELSASIAASTEGVAAAVHWGFDGTAFEGAAGTWRGAAEDLGLDDDLLVAAMRSDDVTQVDVPAVVARATGAVTGWLIPVRSHRGPRPALLSIWRSVPDAPFLGHRRAFLRATDHLELALMRAEEHERLLYLAGHDSLTGAANRASFHAELDAALARGETNLAIGYCDLDGFKQVNDRLGHAIGDEVLVEAAARIRSQLRTGDSLARIGGDEFTILWRNVASPEVAHGVAQRVVEAVAEDMVIGDEKVRVGVSIGVVLGERGTDADALLRLADAALYRSKRATGSITLAG